MEQLRVSDNSVGDSNEVPPDAVDPSVWISGLCGVFAFALQQRYGLKMFAFVDTLPTSDKSGADELLVHAYGVVGDHAIDAAGVYRVQDVLREHEGYWDQTLTESDIAAGAFIEWREVTSDQLLLMNSDIDDTEEALAFLDRSPLLLESIANVLSHNVTSQRPHVKPRPGLR
jgi:hypothetical protein